MDLTTFEQELKKATLDPVKAVQVASEIAINYLAKLHESQDDLRVKVAQEKLKIKDTATDFRMSMTEAEARTEATELFRNYLRAKHQVERAEEIIRIAKVHAKIAGGF